MMLCLFVYLCLLFFWLIVHQKVIALLDEKEMLERGGGVEGMR